MRVVFVSWIKYQLCLFESAEHFAFSPSHPELISLDQLLIVLLEGKSPHSLVVQVNPEVQVSEDYLHVMIAYTVTILSCSSFFNESIASYFSYLLYSLLLVNNCVSTVQVAI